MKEKATINDKIFCAPDVASTITAVFGCKWSIKILNAIQAGVCRPGAMEKALPGLTTRVQSYYFARMRKLGVIDKVSFPEIPPRVEYHLTDYGQRILEILNYIKTVQQELETEYKVKKMTDI